MFNKILIANRGEIACRVVDTARKLGVQTVAVYSDADRAARHVAVADQAVHIGGAAPAESYLRGDVIIQAALDTGAQAIHPGYGFLSEKPDFVAAVEAAGLVFIGPSVEAIRAMGLKDAAKALMEEAGVPVVPGYHGAEQDPSVLAEKAEGIGYPVLIKAVAGGGGKGMRRVDAPEDFAAALASAQAEALGAFGNGAVLIEKYIQKPRHIELQIFGDGTRAVHLFERDCSLQRRHQKVIEEAPAPGMTDAVRQAMGQAAVRATEAIGYAGAGTVEFIVDGSGPLRPDGFWFMEMNTRLQVEHPVTEEITGIDLVEWQLRVAAGESLPVSQGDIGMSGHAIEARLYAEDVPSGFLPATGTLTHLDFGSGARIETGVRAGDTISPWYDPMIAKIIVHGATRDIALTKMDQALAQSEVAGLTTNLTFLSALNRDPDFRSGDMDTGTIERHIDTLSQVPVACSRTRAIAAMGALGLWRRPDPMQGVTQWTPLGRSIRLRHVGEEVAARVTVRGAGDLFVEVEDQRHNVTWGQNGWRIDDAPVSARLTREASTVTVFWRNSYVFEVDDPLDRQTSGAGDTALVVAPMPGLVRQLTAAPGQTVRAGDRLAVLEAMKMEHALLAARDGVVAEVLAATGDQVEAGAPLVRLEPET